MLDWVSVTTIFLAGVSIVVAVYLGYPLLKEARIKKDRARFLQIRRYLKENRLNLTNEAFDFYTKNSAEYELLSCKLEGEKYDAFVLTKAEWIPNPAIALERVKVLKDKNWSNDKRVLKRKTKYYEECDFRSAIEAFEYLWPKSIKDFKLTKYSDIVDKLNPPKLWWDMPHYRVNGINTEKGYELIFRLGKYFGSFSTLEALAYESAVANAQTKKVGKLMKWNTLRARKVFGEPTELDRRCSGLGIETITLFGQNGDYRFVLHRRSSDDVAIAEGLMHIIPAGEFQPSSDSDVMIEKDFDFWKNIMREYYEELIDPSISSERIDYEIDWENDSPFRELNQAKKEGRIKLFFLGFVIDPLNLKPEILTALVFPQQAFYESIGTLKERNEEGKIIWNNRNQTFEGHKFDEKTIRYYLSMPLEPSARACLIAAWNSRKVLTEVDF